MKKTILLLIALFIFGGSFSFAQQKSASNKLKGNGEVFYYEDFDWENPDDPKGWTMPEGYYLEDPDDNGMNWSWLPSDSLIALFTAEPPFQSTSSENGYLGLELNLFNNFEDDALRTTINNNLVFPTFDCSDKTSVVLRFETHFMNGGDGANEVHISSDAGAHWAIFDCGYGTQHKDRPNDAAPGQPVTYEVNISEVAAGAPEVIIKIHWGETKLYFWVIDDFSLSEAYDNDLQIKHIKLEWDDEVENTEESFINYLPISQIGGSLTNFQSSALNFGEYDQNNVTMSVDITKNNQSVFSTSTSTSWLEPLFTDTANLEGAYTPEELGHYKVRYEYSQDEEDQKMADNYEEIFFHVNDSIYSRADDTAELAWAFGFERYGPEDGEEGWNIDHAMATKFNIYGDCEVSSMSVFINGGLADGNIEFWYTLWWLPPPEEDDQTPVPVMTTDILELDSTMFNTWITMPFEKDGESEYLYEGDRVYAGIQYNNFNNDHLVRRGKSLAIGHDASIKTNENITVAYNGEAWETGGFVDDRKLMIRLNLNDHSNIIDGTDLTSSLNTLEQNYPNPFKGSTQIQYDLANNGLVSIEIKDLTGRQVMMIDEGEKSAGHHSCDIDGSRLETGVYFYTLSAGEFVQTKRMIVAK